VKFSPTPRKKMKKKGEKFTPSRFKIAMFNEVLSPPPKKAQKEDF
jgi:hypothetical protein